MLTLIQAAATLGITPQRLGRLIKDGRIPALKFGRVWMLSPSDVESLRGRKVGRPRKVAA